MKKEELAFGLMMIGFEGKMPTSFVTDWLRRGLSGVALFRRNVETAPQVAELTNQLSRVTAEYHNSRLLIAADQEGGRVARFREGFSQIPPMKRLGETKDPEICRKVGRILGRELHAIGIPYNLAPVLDVDTNPKNPVIGDRSFSSDPSLVSELAVALAEGLWQEGVLSCGKHFPGHGDTLQDSHKTLPRLEKSLEELEKVELLPFQEAAKKKIPSIMSAHVIYPALDKELPATLSPFVLKTLLREKLGYQGVIISDDFEMAAIAERFSMKEAAQLALRAGIDIFLVCHREDRQEEVFRALSQCDRNLLEEAYARVVALRNVLRPFAPVNPEEVFQHLDQDQEFLAQFAIPPVSSDPTEPSS